MEGCSSPGQGSPARVEEGAATALTALASPCMLTREVRLWPSSLWPPPPSLQSRVQPPGAGFQSSLEDAVCQQVMESRIWGLYPSGEWWVQ